MQITILGVQNMNVILFIVRVGLLFMLFCRYFWGVLQRKREEVTVFNNSFQANA